MIPPRQAPHHRALRRSWGHPRPRTAPGPPRRHESGRRDLPVPGKRPRSWLHRGSTRSSGQHRGSALPQAARRDAPGTCGNTPSRSSHPRTWRSPGEFSRQAVGNRLPSTVPDAQADVKPGKTRSDATRPRYKAIVPTGGRDADIDWPGWNWTSIPSRGMKPRPEI